MPTIAPQPSSLTVAEYPWTPDQGNGTFRNPVLWADYSDPDAVAVGDDVYLTASSFNCTPGLPILHSRDLVNWTLINHAVKNLPHPRYAQVQHGCGVWAPAIRFHAGRFWIFFPMPDEGIYVTTADDPVGEWSPPHLLVEGKGLIDPCPLWDDDGQAYLVHAYARSRSGIKHRLRVCPMAPDASRLLGEGQIVFDDPERHPTLEGPKFHKRDDYYYISAPAGGVATGWQVILRSRHVYGPYEDKIVLAQGSTPINGPHQGALVDLPSGQTWFLHFQDTGVYGRIVHLQPVRWEDGWPLIGVNRDARGVGEPALHHRKPSAPDSPIAAPATSDEFDASKLGPQWQWHANHREEWWSLTQRPGWLRLFPVESPQGFSQYPALLLQKFPAEAFAVETRVELPTGTDRVEPGLIVMGRDHAACAVRRAADGLVVRMLVNDREAQVLRLPAGAVRLRARVGPGGLCDFAAATGGGPWSALGDRFQATAGMWIGAKVGVFARAAGDSRDGHADFDFFRFAACG